MAWRWSFGAATWTLIFLAVRRVLAQADVSQVELLVARGSDVFQIADACARIIVQVLPKIVAICVVLVPALGILWIAAATLGRAATLKTLLPHSRMRWSSLGGLNFVRAMFAVAGAAAFAGAMLLAGMAMPALNPTLGAAAWISLAVVVIFFWSVVNWFLALAPIWIVRDGRTALRSVVDSVELFHQRRADCAAIATWFGVFRAAALVAGFIAALIAAQAPPAVSIALCVAIALVYFAVADFLYIARLAAYVSLDESRQLSANISQPVAPAPAAAPAPEI